MKFILTTLLGLMVHTLAWTSDITVQGRLIDEEGQGLGYASIVILQASDSVMAAYGITDENGHYVIQNLKKEAYIFQASYVGFDDFERPLNLTQAEIKEIKLPDYTLLKSKVNLDEVVIEERIIPIRINKDTVEYDPRAFKSKEGATVEDLLKKLPGMEVDRDGTVKAQGKEVDRVLVDGKEFFGNDPTTATQNLPADAIKKVQVFDKMSEFSEFSGIDDGERLKTINLQLKDDRKKGLFGKVSFGYGTDNRFESKNNIHSFRKNTQLSVLANGNNINKSVFSFRDYIKFIGGIDQLLSGGGIMLGNNSGISIGNSPKGDNENYGSGINFSHEFSPKTEVSMNYLGTMANAFLDQQIDRDYFNNPNLRATSENNIQNSDQVNHLVQGRIRLKPDSATEWKIDYKGRYQEADASSRQELITINSQETRLRNQSQENQSSLWNGEVSALHRKRMPGNAVWVNQIEGSLTDQDGQNLFTDPFTPNNALNKSVFAPNQTAGLRSSYSVPVGTYFVLSGSAKWNTEKSDQEILFGGFDEGLPSGDIATRGFQNRDFTTMEFRPGIRFKKGNTNVSYNQGITHFEFSNVDTETDAVYFLPFISLSQDFRGNKKLNLTTQRNVSYPSLQNTFEFLDFSQLGRQTIGNPYLLPEDNYNVNLSFNSFSQFSFTSIFAQVDVSHTKNKIRSGLVVDETGLQITKPVNTSEALSSNAYFSFSKGLGKLKYGYTIRGSYSDGFQPNQGQEFRTETYSGSMKATLENRKKEKWDWILGVNYGKNYSYQGGSTQSFDDITAFAEVDVDLSERINLETGLDYSLLYRKGMSTIQIPIQTIEMSASLSKDKRLTGTLKWYDVWNRTQGVFRSTNFLYGEVEQANVLNSYLMVGLRYRLSKFKKKGPFHLGKERMRHRRS